MDKADHEDAMNTMVAWCGSREKAEATVDRAVHSLKLQIEADMVDTHSKVLRDLAQPIPEFKPRISTGLASLLYRLKRD